MTSQTKRKHSETFNTKEFYDLCGNIRNKKREKEFSFDRVRQWLKANKDDDDRLNAAITYHGNLNLTPLHLIMFIKPPLDIIQTIIKYAPEVLKMKDITGRLPIHRACLHGASLEVIQAPLMASPDTIKVTDTDGWLPLHSACWNNDVSLDVLNLMIISYPEGVDHKDKDGRTPLDILKLKKDAEKEDRNGMLPLHHACKKGYSEHLICLLIQAYPKSIEIKDNHNRTPLEYYTSFQGRQLCDEIIELLQPVNDVVSSAPAQRPVQNAEAPPVAQIEDQPLPQRTEENDVEIRNAEMNDTQAEIKAEIIAVKADIRQVQSDLLVTKAEVSEIKTEVSEIKTEVSEIKSMIGDMQRFLNGIVSG